MDETKQQVLELLYQMAKPTAEELTFWYQEKERKRVGRTNQSN